MRYETHKTRLSKRVRSIQLNTRRKQNFLIRVDFLSYDIIFINLLIYLFLYLYYCMCTFCRNTILKIQSERAFSRQFSNNRRYSYCCRRDVDVLQKRVSIVFHVSFRCKL